MTASRAGKEGEKKEYELRLKMIADVGFIGFPNAGKSTLLASVSDHLHSFDTKRRDNIRGIKK